MRRKERVEAILKGDRWRRKGVGQDRFNDNTFKMHPKGNVETTTECDHQLSSNENLSAKYFTSTSTSISLTHTQVAK